MKLDNKKVIYASLAFGWITIFWFGYDNLIQTININTFAMRTPVSGLVLAIDNILGLFCLPLFGWLSDKCNSRFGKRTPFVIIGTLASLAGLFVVGVAAHEQILWLYIVALIVTLFAMAAYRSPALSMVPDITPEPLRSRANAISNIVSALFNVVAIAIVTPFLTDAYIDKNNYYPIIIGIIAASLITVVVFLKTYNEPRAVKEFNDQMYAQEVEERKLIEQTDAERTLANRGFEQEDIDKRSAVFTKNNNTNTRNKVLILAAVFFFYMAYNALVSNFSNYAGFVLNLELRAIPLVVTMVGAIAGFVPATKYAAKHSRKKAILLGFILMASALTVVAIGGLTVVSNALADGIEMPIIYACFAVAGFGYGFVMVNVYPLFLEYSGAESIGQGTGIFASAMTLAMVITPILAGFIIEAFGEMWDRQLVNAAGELLINERGEPVYADYRMLTPYSAINLACAIVVTCFIKEPARKKLAEVKRGLDVFDV